MTVIVANQEADAAKTAFSFLPIAILSLQLRICVCNSGFAFVTQDLLSIHLYVPLQPC